MRERAILTRRRGDAEKDAANAAWNGGAAIEGAQGDSEACRTRRKRRGGLRRGGSPTPGVAPVNARTLWVAHSLPSCPTTGAGAEGVVTQNVGVGGIWVERGGGGGAAERRLGVGGVWCGGRAGGCGGVICGPATSPSLKTVQDTGSGSL